MSSSGARGRLAVVAVLAAVGVAACGSDDSDSSSSGGGGETGGEPAGSAETRQLKADPGGALSYDTDSLSAQAGRVKLVMDNPSQLSHDVSIEGPGVDEHGEVVPEGGTSTVTADLDAGTYTFYCSVPGHREGGMQGTLTVR